MYSEHLPSVMSNDVCRVVHVGVAWRVPYDGILFLSSNAHFRVVTPNYTQQPRGALLMATLAVADRTSLLPQLSSMHKAQLMQVAIPQSAPLPQE